MKSLIILSLFYAMICPSVLNNTKGNSHFKKNEKKMNHLTFNAHLKQEIPSKTYTWGQMTAGDCVLGAGSSVTIWADGNVKFSGIVWTNHTHSGDQWHHIITFQDYRGLTLFSIRFEGPVHMNDNGSRYNFGPYWQKYNPQFFNQVAKATANGSC